MNLQSLRDLRQKWHMKEPTIQRELEAAGVKPMHTMQYGRGSMVLYDAAAADAAIKAVHDARMAKRAARPATPNAADTEESQKALAELSASVKDGARRTLESCSDIEVKLESALAELGKLSAQNAILLRTITDIKVELVNRIDAVQAAVDRPANDQPIHVDKPTTIAAGSEPAQDAKKQRLMRVGIVSLLDSQAAIIEREYKDCFDLRVIKSGDGRGSKQLGEALRSCDAVLGLTNFLGHSISEALNKAGVRVINVSGGMTSLRDALTKLYIESSGSKLAA